MGRLAKGALPKYCKETDAKNGARAYVKHDGQKYEIVSKPV